MEYSKLSLINNDLQIIIEEEATIIFNNSSYATMDSLVYDGIKQYHLEINYDEFTNNISVFMYNDDIKVRQIIESDNSKKTIETYFDYNCNIIQK